MGQLRRDLGWYLALTGAAIHPSRERACERETDDDHGDGDEKRDRHVDRLRRNVVSVPERRHADNRLAIPSPNNKLTLPEGTGGCSRGRRLGARLTRLRADLRFDGLPMIPGSVLHISVGCL